MFGRRVAVTLVKPRKKNENNTELVAEETATFAEIAETAVELAAGLGAVVLFTSAGLAGVRIVEHIVKTVYR